MFNLIPWCLFTMMSAPKIFMKIKPYPYVSSTSHSDHPHPTAPLSPSVIWERHQRKGIRIHRSQVTASKLSPGVGEALRTNASQSEDRALCKCAGPLCRQSGGRNRLTTSRRKVTDKGRFRCRLSWYTWTEQEEWCMLVPWNCGILQPGFNLSKGCFGPTLSKIAPNGQIWDFTGSRYDGSAPNYVARLF